MSVVLIKITISNYSGFHVMIKSNPLCTELFPRKVYIFIPMTSEVEGDILVSPCLSVRPSLIADPLTAGAPTQKVGTMFKAPKPMCWHMADDCNLKKYIFFHIFNSKILISWGQWVKRIRRVTLCHLELGSNLQKVYELINFLRIWSWF